MNIRPGEKLRAVGWFMSGKTTGVRLLAEKAPAAIAWDPTGEFAKAGWRRCRVDGIAAAVKQARFVAVQGDPETDLPLFCSVALQLRGWIVILDEISLSIAGAGPGALRGTPSQLWRLGHKTDISVWYTTHRISEAPVLLRYTEHLLHFRVGTELDARTLAAEYGDATAAAAANLQPHHFVYVGPDAVPHSYKPLPLRTGPLDVTWPKRR